MRYSKAQSRLGLIWIFDRNGKPTPCLAYINNQQSNAFTIG